MALEISKKVASEFRYEVIIYWSEEDHALIAEVPELPGCAADGATYQETIANAEMMIQEWIETARELGRTIPEPRGGSLYARSLQETTGNGIAAGAGLEMRDGPYSKT